MTKDFTPGLLKRRKQRSQEVPIDALGTETWDEYPRPSSPFMIGVRDLTGEWCDIEVSPSEFNPLTISAGICFGEIAVTDEVRCRLIAECGIFLPEVGTEITLN